MHLSANKTRCVAFLFLLAPLAANLQSQGRGIAPVDTTKIHLRGDALVAVIPFELQSNHVILPISVNGSEPFRIVLDTGMPYPGLMLYGTKKATQLDLNFNPAMQVQIGGAGGNGSRHTARMAMSENLSLPGVAIQGTRVLMLPPLQGMASSHDGIIGRSLFDRFVVELDFATSTLRLHEPASYSASKTATSLPFSLVRGVPHVVLRVSAENGAPYDAEVVVDLGASHALSLNTDASKRIQVPSAHVESPVGRGLSGTLHGKIGRLAFVELAGHRLENVLVTYPESRHQNPRGVKSLHGNLGTEILHRFKTTFDYGNHRMLLEPNQSFSELFSFNTSGIVLALSKDLIVDFVIAQSPAEKAGIRPGDVLTHLEGRPLDGTQRSEIRDLLEGNGTVRLILRRDKKEIVVSLSLRKLV